MSKQNENVYLFRRHGKSRHGEGVKDFLLRLDEIEESTIPR